MTQVEKQLRNSATDNLAEAQSYVVGAIYRLIYDHGHQYGNSKELDTLQRIGAELETIRFTLIANLK